MKILVLGSMNIDKIYRVHDFVKSKETIHVCSLDTSFGGKGFNQAIALARAGSAAAFAGIIGTDGERFAELLACEGIDTTHLKRSSSANGHTIIQVNDAGENCIMVAAGANAETDETYIRSVLSQTAPGDWVLLQNEIANVDYAIELAHACGLHIALNPSPFEEKLTRYALDKVQLLLVNEIEGAGLTGTDDPARMLRALRQRYPQAGVLLTLGERGALFADTSGAEYRTDSVPCTVCDTTAAGDTFTGYFLTEYLRSGDAAAALTIAATASSIAVSRPGAAASIPVRSEVLACLGTRR